MPKEASKLFPTLQHFLSFLDKIILDNGAALLIELVGGRAGCTCSASVNTVFQLDFVYQLST